jgi:DNA-binding NtrC family response regulator
MQRLLIAEQDGEFRKRMATLFIEAGYHVTVTDSVANALHDVLKRTAQVVILSSEFDEVRAADLIPLFKKCNRDLSVILVTGELSLPLIRRLRKEGIFYHALQPAKPEDGEEIRQAVRCAFEHLNSQEMRRPA